MYEAQVETGEVTPERAEAADGECAPEAPRKWRPWIARGVIVVLAPVLFFGAVELVLTALGIGYSTSLTQPCTVHGRPANCYNLFFPAPFFPPGMIKTPEVYAVPADKPKGTYRIFVLGESAAMGDPDPAYSFSRYLEVMLAQSFPEMKFEVYNTGSVAINSHVSLLIAKDLVKLQPDLVIIYSGNNEVVGPYGPGTVLSSSGMWLPVVRASIWFRSTRIGQLLTKLGSQKQEWGGMEMFLDKQVPAGSPPMKYVYANFDTNLRDTIAAAHDAGARVIVSTIATNTKDCAPFASQHRAGLSQGDLKKWSALVDEGSRLDSAAAYDQAVQLYLKAAKIDAQYAELEFRIARCLSKMGNDQQAAQHYSRARDLDTLRFRADSRINQINRAAANAGAEVVDADAIFAQYSPDGSTGSDLVFEHVHMTPAGNYLLAREIFLNIASQIARHPIEEGEIPSQADCERMLALTGYDRYRITNEMLQRMQRPPFTTQLNHSEQELRLAVAAEAPVESPNDTAAEYRTAITQRPEDRILRYNYGLFLYNFDRHAGAEQLTLSQPWDGFPVYAPDGLRLQ
jgi:tetratricopeptide (TPR) repeat protein